ncbi:putative EndoIII-related endonuclease [Methanocella conradii HZ254]|uniref:EndoIII-related endonuclease n=2 Tax=Methanocella TaxID=570266 RepID=H8I560_METCZ|nr:putative EndoIII-related endonuclease [Methanocella conradii HZ254]
MDIDLRSTMDIQITALEWMPQDGRYVRYYPEAGIDVFMEQRPDGSIEVTPHEFHDEAMSIFDYPLSEVYHGDSEILLRLQEFYRRCWVLRLQDPFISLMITILTQNKTADSARRTFHRLQRRYKGIDVHKMACADKRELEELIRFSGPYKASYMIECSRQIEERWGGSLEWMRRAPTDEARRALLSLHGVGPKTADCVLLFSLGHSVVPVDTHICRVSQRLGLSMSMGDSEAAKRRVKEDLERGLKMPGMAHLLIINLGRDFCKALAPLHHICPVEELCPKRGVVRPERLV